VRAVPLCLATSKPLSPLLELSHVEATILGSRAISRVHDEFFDDPTPTDVITFDTGEILLGAASIVENGKAFQQPGDHELALCIIHGLLHLGGYRDKSDQEFREMDNAQRGILQQVLLT